MAWCPICLEQDKYNRLETINKARSRCPICGEEVVDQDIETNAIRITEARLYSFCADCIHCNEPLPGESKDICLAAGAEEGRYPTPTEAQAMANIQVKRQVSVIKRTYDTLAKEDKRLIFMRYFQRNRPIWVAKQLNLSLRQMYNKQKELVCVFAKAMGLL
jgi:hypothetical protein